MSGPPGEVLDLFAVPDDVESIPGGRGTSVRAGDLVLSPGRDPAVAGWLSPVLARLAVRLDEDPLRASRDLRIAVPVPARDGSWVVDGWGASRFEAGTSLCRDLGVTLAAGRVLHARLASAVPTRPDVLDARTDRWASAERLVFGPVEELVATTTGTAAEALVRAAAVELDRPTGTAQLVHADLAGNVLLDPAGAPVVIDVSPAWRPVRWAEAVCVLDSVLWLDAPEERLAGWAGGAHRQDLLRALLWRAISDEGDTQAYERVLGSLSAAGTPG